MKLATLDAPPTQSDEALNWLDMSNWDNQPVPEREWAVRDRVPMANVTLLSGEGAIGKSIVALHLAAAHALGRDWLGVLPEPGPAIVVACEDDENELHRRLASIVEHYGASFADLKNLHLLSLAGKDALLAVPDKAGLIAATKLLSQLAEAARDLAPRLIVLDNSADVFGGNENDRAQVRQFIGLLRGLAITAHTAVLLTSHPSLTGISSGTGLSGSTAWHASVRARLYMKRARTDRDEEPDPDLRVLEVMKNNYGPVGETIMMRWQKGLFLPVAGTGTLDKLATEQAAEQMFLELLDAFGQQGRNVSDKKAAHAYAPAAFCADPRTKQLPVARKALAEAMARLFTAGKIRVETYGRPSRPYSKLVRTVT